MLTWAEEGRARHLLSRPARPPDDPELAAMLGRLRVTVAEIEERCMQFARIASRRREVMQRWLERQSGESI